jgi:Cys-tRNA(Pro)/Cys-tRNA(Cys) deacylase
MVKTQAMRVLEGLGIPYTAHAYPAHERDAQMVAEHLDVPAGQVFKTLVVPRHPGKNLLVLIPADRKLDLKRLAKAVGDKKVKMATHAEAEKLTGLEVGGISPLALLNRGFSIVADASLVNWPTVFVSAGKKGINLGVAPEELLSATGAELHPVAAAAS